VKETHVYERDRIVPSITEEQFDVISKARRNRIEINKDLSKLQQMAHDLKDHMTHIDCVKDELQEKYQQAAAAAMKASNRVEKLKYNFEVVVYLRQGQNEVPQQPVATDYKDAIFINKDIVEDQNGQIVKRGDKKVDLLDKIAEFKTGLKKVKYQKQKLDLEIKDFEERAKDV
jgi:predicted  nucleic acid-binding Zn-ribbon protein